MAPGPLTSWHVKGEKVETVTDFIFLGSKITAEGDCSHENSGLISLRIDWFDLLAVQGTVFSNTTAQKHQFFST